MAASQECHRRISHSRSSEILVNRRRRPSPVGIIIRSAALKGELVAHPSMSIDRAPVPSHLTWTSLSLLNAPFPWTSYDQTTEKQNPADPLGHRAQCSGHFAREPSLALRGSIAQQSPCQYTRDGRPKQCHCCQRSCS